MEKSDLTLLTENILKECTKDYENISCSVIEPYIRGVALPYVLTCGIRGKSATLDWDGLLQKVAGDENKNGAIEGMIGGEKHTLYITMLGRHNRESL